MASRKISLRTARACAQAGFTIIEILVVISLLAIISGIGLVVSMESYRGYAFRSDRDMLVSLLERARAQSVNNICIGTSCTNGRPHGVYINATTSAYVLFQGASYGTRDVAVDEVTPANQGSSRFGAVEVVFTQLSGSTGTTSEIVLSGGAGKVSTTTVNTQGRISWTN